MRNSFISILSFLSLAILLPSASAEECVADLRSANDLYKCALERDPRIRSLMHREKESAGRDKEARQFPNPVGELEGTTDEFSGSIVQPIELGGKRSARIELSKIENEASQVEEKLEYGEAALDVIQNVTKLVQINTKLKLLEDTKKSLTNLASRLGAKSVRTPEERTALSLFRMQATLTETRLIGLRREQAEARVGIQASLGSKLGDLNKVTSFEIKKWPDLGKLKPIPGLSLRVKELALKRFEAEARAQTSAAWPDLALGPYFSKNQKDGDNSIGAKIEFGLPLWNRNRGGIQRSQAQFEQARIASEFSLTQTKLLLENIIESYKDLISFLSQGSSSHSLQRTVSETLQLFSRGMIQPSNVIETYRSAFETMEAVQDAEYTAITYYWLIQTARGEFPKEIP